MTRLTLKIAYGFFAAAVLVATSAGLADAAPARVAINTNLRQGPGVNFAVITTLPAGSVVNVIRCGAEWCNVMVGGTPGYMIARNLSAGGPPPVAVVAPPPPPVVVVAPPVYYGGYRRYYPGPRYYYGGPYRRW